MFHGRRIINDQVLEIVTVANVLHVYFQHRGYYDAFIVCKCAESAEWTQSHSLPLNGYIQYLQHFGKKSDLAEVS